MSLTKRYHESLLEKIDELEVAVGISDRDIKSEFKEIDDRMQANAASFRRIQDLNEKYHEQNKRLLSARQELLEITDNMPKAIETNIPHPEEL